METPPFGTYSPAPWRRTIIDLTRRLPESWLGRRIALLLRKPVLKTLSGDPVDLEILGFRMRLMPYDNVSEKRLMFTPQFFDSAELALLGSRIIPDAPFQFIDVGANAGTYSLFVAARAGDKAKILAVEPQPVMLRRFATNIVLNGFRTIQVSPVAVADKEGTIDLHLDASNCGGASITDNSIADENNTGKVVSVPCIPLLTLMDKAGITQADAMKIDIEGAEDIVLGSFLRTAPRERWPKILFMERNSRKWREDVLALAIQSGYRETSAGRMNVILELSSGA